MNFNILVANTGNYPLAHHLDMIKITSITFFILIIVGFALWKYCKNDIMEEIS